MKKNWKVLAGVVVIAIIAVWFYFNNSSGTIKESLRDFAIKDTSSVTKIFLANKTGNTILLERANAGEWKLNEKYIARTELVKVLLKTMKILEVKQPVQKAARENVLKKLASTGTKVEVYSGEDLIKLYYVGGETQDQLGTFMLLADEKTGENSSIPFVMYIPGFEGYLSSRYSCNLLDWRDRSIFKYTPIDIKSIKVENSEKPEDGFELNVLSVNNFSVKKLSDNKTVSNLDTMSVKQYLAYFQNLNAEGFDLGSFKNKKDSILNSKVINTITVTDKNNQKKTLKTFYLQNIRKKSDSYGNLLKYDPESMYCTIDNDGEVILIQYYQFGKVFQPYSYFEIKTGNTTVSVKK